MDEVKQTQGLYRPEFEHDACGTGFTAHIKGRKSHHIIRDALTMLENMEHRGACGCEQNTGDGAGILFQTPHEFLYDECLKLGICLPEFGKYGVGMVFFPKEPRWREECREIFQRSAEKLGLEILGYRKVPVRPDGIGETALSVEPEIEQVFKKASPWDAIKDAGAAAIPPGTPTQHWKRLQELGKAIGLWIVPVGELEGFCKAVGGHGPRWVQQVIEARDLSEDNELSAAREFVKNVWAGKVSAEPSSRPPQPDKGAEGGDALADG